MPLDWKSLDVSTEKSDTTSPTIDWRSLGTDTEKSSLTGQQIASSIDRYQAGLYGVAEAATGSKWLKEKREQNEFLADVEANRARELGAVDEWKNVHGVGDFGSYAKSMAIQSLPYAAEALVGGVAARGAMSGTRAALTAAKEAKDVAGVARAQRALNLGSEVGGVAASYPSAVGDVLSNQREQSGETRGGVAAALAVPYAALNAVGVEGALMKGNFFKNTVNLLDRPGGLTGAAARMAATGASTALKEGASETGQEMLNQIGRMSVDSSEKFLSDAAQERFKESFIGGATLGGLAGAGLGGWRRSGNQPPANDVQQAMAATDATQPDITTQQFQQTSVDPATRLAELEAKNQGTPAREIVNEDGEIIRIPGRDREYFTPAERAEYAALKQKLAPAAPAVAGGSTDIAQAQREAQAALQQQQAQAEQAQAADQAAQQFGVVNPATPAVGSAFGQKVYGKNISAVANAIATFTAQMPPQQVQLAQAITQANALTGGKLISFQFNANNVMASVEQGLKAIGKVATKLQIDQAETAEEAAAILDDQSTQLKGDKLEQVNAIHQALTGQDTTGYQAEQLAKGAKDDKLQLQTNAGLREVPVSGGPTETGAGGNGLLRSTEVQPFGATSVGAGPSDQQAGQLPTEGVRTGATGNAPANDVGQPTPNTQVNEAPNVQATKASTETGARGGQANEPRETGKPNVVETVSTGSGGPRIYRTPTEYYNSDMMHIRPERRSTIVGMLFGAVLHTSSKVATTDKRVNIMEMTLMEGMTSKQIAAELGLTESAVEKQRERMGLREADDGTMEIATDTPEGQALLNRMVETAADFRSPEFPDGIGAMELAGLYAAKDLYFEDGEFTHEGVAADEEQEGRPGAKLAEELYNADTSETRTMGTIGSIGGSQGAVDEFGGTAEEKFYAKIGKLNAYLEMAKESGDTEGAANVEKQLQAEWAKFGKQQAARTGVGEVEVAEPEAETDLTGKPLFEEEENAVQEPSTEKVPVRKRARSSKAVGKGNAEGGKAATEGQAKVEPKQEEVKTPKEQYEALAETTNLLPPYESLDARERAQVDDQAHQGELTLASLNTMFSGNAKFGKDVRAKKPYSAAELTKEIEDFTRTAVSGHKLVIVDSVEDLLKSTNKETQKIGAVLAVEGAFGVAVNGKAYLIANRIEKGRGRAKFMHEVGAHLGLETILPTALYNRLTQQIVNWAKQDGKTTESKLAIKAAERVMNAQTAKEDQRAELLAYFIEEAVQAGIDPTVVDNESVALREWFRALWAALRAAVRKLGFNPEAMTAQDIVDMAFGAAQLELAADTTTEGKAPKFGFAGVNATGAATEERQAGLVAAQMDLANGEDPKTVWEKTGWYKGTDGQWRFEIDDTNAQFKGILEGKKFSDIARMEKTTLGEVLSHDELFANYPELKDVKFEVRPIPMDFQRSTQGWFDIKLNKLFVTPYAIDPLSTVLHEVQHWIQNKEGFENGANPNGSDLSNKIALGKLRNELTTAVNHAEALKADQQAAVREGRYVSIFDALMAAGKAEDLIPAVDALLARSAEIAPMYAQLRTLDAEIERVENARKVLAQKQKDQNKQASLVKKVIDYAGQMKDLRIYSDKAREAQKQRDEINNQLKAAVIDITGGKDVAYELYRLVAGEAEARNVQKRQNLTAEERRASFPEATMDVRSENTLRSTGRGGAYMSTERMRFGKEAAQPAGVFSKAGEWLDETLTHPKEALRKLKLGFLTLDQLAQLDKTPGQVVRGYSDVMTAMQKLSKDMIYKAAQIDQLWAKLSPTEAAKLSQVMRDATRAGFDPDKPHGPVRAEDAAKAQLVDDFAALTPAAQDIYRKVRKHYEDSFNARLDIMREVGGKLGGKALEEIDRLYSKLQGPYFPLGRTGRYFAVGMSPELAALQEKKDAGELTRKEAREMVMLRKDANHYQTFSFDTLKEAKKKADELRADLGYAYHNVAEERLSTELTNRTNFAKLEERINAELGGEARAEVRSMLSQMMFDMLPEHHALKRQMKREGIHGEDTNMRRVFAQTSISQAHYISRLKFSNELDQAMRAVNTAARRDIEMREIENELKLRTKVSMDNTQSALVDSLVNASYFAHLGLSPAFLLTNMTQVPMITAPWLGARHGVGATKRAMAMALADTAKIIKSSFKGGDWRSEIDWSELFPAGSNEDRMFRDLLDRNVLDITMEHDLAAVASAQKGLFDDKIAKATNNKLGGMSDVVKLVNTPVRVTELANRAVTALSAYRLKMESLASHPTMTPEERHTAAVDYAARAVSETQLNYSELNAPRHMRQVLGSKPIAKMVFQFRKFQQGMLYLVAKNIADSLPGSSASKEDRRIARRTIAGLYMTTGLMAGTTGMPLMGTVGLAGIANLIAAAFGDDDEPWDFETEYRNFLTDWLGHDLALLVAKGVPAALGADISQRVGMGDIANPIPFVQRGATGQSTIANAMYAAGGASVGMVGTMYDGIVAMANGDVMKGMEKVIPVKAVKDALRTYRYADEGMTDKRGNVILPPEKFDTMDLVLRGMGFTPTKESEYYAANAAMQSAKTAATDVRTRLLREYSEAKLKGESTEAVDAKIVDFNERHPEKSVKIDMSTKLKAVQARRKMAAERTESGLRVGKYEKPFANEARFATEE
jgi:hypothetical protein